MLPSMVFYTVTKLIETNLNITIRSKKVDSVRSFHFWPESEHRFGSGPISALNATEHGFLPVTKLTETNLNITIGSKKVDWVRSFCFWPESEHRFSSGPNQCIKWSRAWFFAQ